ncbi:tail fiber domain-containing protein [Rhodobacter sp. Har01]|uniref:tail fiber domain-containing protein n=1 Tax=Rhodobacter sp. Har01 TaxID=2883999 RepID=UPI001D070A5D|nr:tail fiber domain-containing protein [Rhodobacter sp. Har01]MCB6177190.1 tail fiber domain-containing protein [Rhodobacter sp. Har01]
MKKCLLLSSALVFGSLSLAQAGGLAEPVMEPEVIRQDASSSASHDAIVPLMLILFMATIASAGSGSPAAATSDVRLKEDVRQTGMTAQGLPLYRWRYAGLPATYEGVLAQDVAMIRPDALVELPFGYKAVDYGRLGLPLRRLT